MAVNVKISQVPVEVVSDQDPGKVRDSQTFVESVSRQEAGKVRASQAFAESVSIQEAGKVRASQTFIEVVSTEKGRVLAECPLFPSDLTYKPPPNTLAGNQVYTWRVRPLFDGVPGDFTGCCLFEAISTGVRTSQTSIEVVRQNL